MNHRAILLSIASFAAATTPAFAETDWEGFYAGLSLDASKSSASAGGAAGHNYKSKEAAIGLYVGKNYATRSGIVWGPEFSLKGLGNSGTQTGAGLGTTNFKGSFIAAPKIRAGFTRGNALFYGTVGLGITDASVQPAGATGKSLYVGGVYGVGAEFAVGNGWSTRIEATAYDFSSSDETFGGTTAAMGYKSKTLSLGLSKKF